MYDSNEILNDTGGLIQNITIYVRDYIGGDGPSAEEQERILLDYASRMENARIRNVYRDKEESDDALCEMIGHLFLSVEDNTQFNNKLLIYNTDRFSDKLNVINSTVNTLNDFGVEILTMDPKSHYPAEKRSYSFKTSKFRKLCDDVVAYTRTDDREPEWKCKEVQDARILVWAQKYGHNIVRTFHDIDHGKGFDRKGLQALYGFLIMNRGVSKVVVPYVNTLQEDAFNMASKYLADIGVSLCSTDLNNIDFTHNPESIAFHNQMTIFYELKRKAESWDQRMFELIKG